MWIARAALIGSILLGSSVVEAQEWTRFRGPNGTGISNSPTIPARFTSSDFNWRVELPGVGHSSPVIWGSRIFLTSAEEEKGRRHLLCLNASDGKILWTRSFAFEPYSHHDFNTAASVTPTVDAERVYTVWPAPESFTVVAVDHHGKEAWSKDFGNFPTQHGGGASPVLWGDLLVVTKEADNADGSILALNRRTGEVVWRHDRYNQLPTPYATPIVHKGEGGADELLIANTTNGITALDPGTGKTRWETGKLFTQRVVASLIEAAGLIIGVCGEGGGFRSAAAVRPGKNAQVVYRLTKGTSYVPTPIAYNGLLFFWHDGGVVLCVKPETGETIWQERVGGGSYFGSPVCAGGKLYAMSAKGELVVIEAADRFSPIARIDLGEASHATPAVSGGVLYLRTLSHLISVGGKTTSPEQPKRQ